MVLLALALAEHLSEAVILVACLLLAAFFAASETALFSLRRSERNRLANEPTPGARAATDLLARPRTLLVVILLMGVSIDALFFSVSADFAAGVARIHGNWAIPAIGAISVVFMLILGEIIPKAFAATAPRKAAL